MAWLPNYAEQVALSDQLKDRGNHLFLLAAGLVGEAGSVLAELKKQQREREAYPFYRRRVLEELGDFLWYFVRVADCIAPDVLRDLPSTDLVEPVGVPNNFSLAFATKVGEVASLVDSIPQSDVKRQVLVELWRLYREIVRDVGLKLEDVARQNLAKIQSRWPLVCDFRPLFDESCLPEDRFPRQLSIQFIENRRPGSNSAQVLLRYGAINIGDRLTDNITEPDAYRYHDVFHMAYAVFLGWSPVTRSLLKCKRKGDPSADENQDGARAAIIEEAVSAIVFSRAKHMKYFAGVNHVDYDLLKSIQEFIVGFEVESVPIWQWERAILEGFKVFRNLRDDGPGGIVSWDLESRRLTWSPPQAAT